MYDFLLRIFFRLGGGRLNDPINLYRGPMPQPITEVEGVRFSDH